MPHTKIRQEVHAYVDTHDGCFDAAGLTQDWLADAMSQLDRVWALDLTAAVTALKFVLRGLDSEQCQPGDCTRDPVVLAALPLKDPRGVHYLHPDIIRLVRDMREMALLLNDVLPARADRHADQALVHEAIRTVEDAAAAMRVLRRGHGLHPWSHESMQVWSTEHQDIVTNALNLLAHTVSSVERSTQKVRQTATTVLDIAADFGGGPTYT